MPVFRPRRCFSADLAFSSSPGPTTSAVDACAARIMRSNSSLLASFVTTHIAPAALACCTRWLYTVRPMTEVFGCSRRNRAITSSMARSSRCHFRSSNTTSGFFSRTCGSTSGATCTILLSPYRPHVRECVGFPHGR